jgi:hypothetical protein
MCSSLRLAVLLGGDGCAGAAQVAERNHHRYADLIILVGYGADCGVDG